MQEEIQIGGVVIGAGQRVTVDLPIARLYSRASITMPVHVIHGKRAGPRLFVSAAIHGDEINGVEIIRRLLKLKALKGLRGTLIAIPIVNVYGFISRSRYLPDRRDLNRSFPGLEAGSLASRLAKLLMDEIVGHCTYGIDIHTGSNHRTNLPQIRADLEDSETRRIANAFGAPVIVDARLRDGSLREAVAEKGIPMLLYEAGEALRFDEVPIKTGVRGVVSVMREIGLLKGRPSKGKTIVPLIVHTTKWVRAHISGILYSGARVGERVPENDLLGIIGDPLGETEERVLSPMSGIVIGRTNLPLVHRGDALFNIAAIEESTHAKATLKAIESGLYAEDMEFEETI
jgi:predicted deacylase